MWAEKETEEKCFSLTDEAKKLKEEVHLHA